MPSQAVDHNKSQAVQLLTDCGWPQWVKLVPGAGFQDLGGELNMDWAELGAMVTAAGMGV